LEACNSYSVFCKPVISKNLQKAAKEEKLCCNLLILFDLSLGSSPAIAPFTFPGQSRTSFANPREMKRVAAIRQPANLPTPRSGGELAALDPRVYTAFPFLIFNFQHNRNLVSYQVAENYPPLAHNQFGWRESSTGRGIPYLLICQQIRSQSITIKALHPPPNIF
jgi:hypothetical protein